MVTFTAIEFLAIKELKGNILLSSQDNLNFMQRYLISYEFTDGEDQEEGGEMLLNWYESGGPQNRPENYEVHSWIFMVQNGIGHSVVSADSLETIWKQWHPWRRLMDINIQPCLDLDETVSLFKKQKMNTRMD